MKRDRRLLIATAKKDLYDFNPSPHSYEYYGVVELNDLFARHGFEAEFFGDTHVMINIVTLIRVMLNMPDILSVWWNRDD